VPALSFPYLSKNIASRKKLNVGHHNDSLNAPLAFVCVTGQAGRVELSFKTRTLLNPLSRWAHIKMSLLLGAGSPQYANSANVANKGEQSSSLTQISSRVHDIFPDAEVVQQSRGNDPLINKEYLKRLHKDPKTNIRRVKSHVQQWTASAACFGRLEMWERSLGAFFFDYFIRVRDDGVLPRLNIPSVFGYLEGHVVPASECDDHRGGMNDKIAFGTRSSAFPYLTAPLLQYVNGAVPNATLLNPEAYWL
jgi:hypothetical protein